MAYANILGYVKKWVILVNNWVGYIRYIAYISRVIRDKSYEEVLVVMRKGYVLVDNKGRLIGNRLYTSAKDAHKRRSELEDKYGGAVSIRLMHVK